MNNKIFVANSRERIYSTVSYSKAKLKEKKLMDENIPHLTKEKKDAIIEEGIKFYDSGKRIDNLNKEELDKLNYFFKLGYDIAKRREYANNYLNEYRNRKR